MKNNFAFITMAILVLIAAVISPASAQADGILKICKVAGPGVAVGTPFHFWAGTHPVTVPAGPAPGGTCVVGPTLPAGPVAIVEIIPPGDTVMNIAVAPSAPLNINIPAGIVNVAIGNGVTEVTYTNKRTGFLEICKQGNVQGNFTFYVNPGGLGPYVVPAGACSPAIEVPAGQVIITEVPSTNGVMVGCATIPVLQQGFCSLSTMSSTVTVAAGDISAQTIAFITNRRLIPAELPDASSNPKQDQ